MRAPARPNPGKVKVAKQKTLPAPTLGWYVGTNLADAPKQTALVMDNWFPQQDYVRFRRGSEVFATGMTGNVETILTYQSTAGKMFACNAGKIYDITAGGAVGAAAVSGLTNNKWQGIQFTSTGGTFLIAVNGADAAQIYDGATWATTPAITGVSSANLTSVWAFKNRPYFAEKGKLKAWYLAVDSIGGAATSLDLSGIFTLGGTLLTGASWAVDANSGLYETCIFVTDQGEVAMYDGAYPGDPEWTLKGVYRIGKPLGRDCILKAGGDLAVVTEDGIVPMSKVMTLDRIALANDAITQPIAPAWRQAVLDRIGMTGWSITVWPLESMAIINLPQLDANDRQQYVANARSGAWCRYTGWDAKCFAVNSSTNRLYYGTSDGRVMRAESGGTDDGSLYSGKVVFSYDDFGVGPARKQMKAIRPLFRTTYNVNPTIEVLVDFDTDASPAPSAAPENLSGALWDTAVWDAAAWPGTQQQRASWRSVTGFGSVVAPCMQVTISSDTDPDLRLQQMDVLYELGEALG